MNNKPKLRRYHYKVYFPENIGDMLQEFFAEVISVGEIGKTHHSKKEQECDAKNIVPNLTLDIAMHPQNILVECYELIDPVWEAPTGKLQKVVLRVRHLDPVYDYTYVLAREGFVVTNWANHKQDIHKLESQNKYYTPDKVFV